MAFEDENKEENYAREDSEAPAHHPSPPPDEVAINVSALISIYLVSFLNVEFSSEFLILGFSASSA